MSADLRWRPIGDGGVLVDFPELDAESAWRRVVALDRAIVPGGGVLESSPASINLLVRFDPLVTDHQEVGRLVAALETDDEWFLAPTEHELDITYDGPDLGAVADACGLDVDDVAAAHAGATFRVRMIGFAPGYAYLDGLPESLRLPRKATAVRDVPAGSVIIANDQCIVTTLTMPTGWRVIGRSATPILTPHGVSPVRVAVGDVVRFRPAVP